jgi:sugar fermentation stimulation protein A
VKREVKFEDSRFDVYAENEKEKCFIEVKNVSMKVGDAALFPDAVTTRGRKHLETLIRVKKQGVRAVMVYIIQRMDVNAFGPARHIDPNYADSLEKAKDAGVEVIALQAKVNPMGIQIIKELNLITQ